MTTRGSWIKWPLKSSHPNQFQSKLRQRKQRNSVTLTDECVFRAVGRGNGWESPWWRCIWSFGIHATPYPVSPDWSKGKGPACLFRGLSRPAWQMQSPGKAAGPSFICAGYLLRRSVCSFAPVFFLSFHFHRDWRAYSVGSAAMWWPQDQTAARLYSYKWMVNKVLYRNRCRAQLQSWVTSEFVLLIPFWLAFQASRLQ